MPDDDFDFVISLSKGTCSGTQVYICSNLDLDTQAWKYVSGTCSGTCTDSSQVCAAESTAALGSCTFSNLGQQGTVGCTCQ